VPRLRQTEVQHAEQHEDAERRQAHAAPQRQAHSRQHDHLVSAELAEILRPPFDDERQRLAERQDADRRQDQLRAVRVETNGAERERGERDPVRGDAAALRRRRQPDRLAGDDAGHRQAEDEAAVQISPQRQQRQQPPRRRAPGVDGADQRGDPRHHQRQRQNVRPRHDVRRGQHQRRQHRGERRCRLPIFEQIARQQAEGRRGRRRRQRRDRDPAAQRIRRRIGNLRQPLVGDPVGGVHGLRQRLAGRQRAVFENEAAERNVPIGVGVAEKPVAQHHEQQIDRDRHEPRHRRRDVDAAADTNCLLGHARLGAEFKSEHRQRRAKVPRSLDRRQASSAALQNP